MKIGVFINNKNPLETFEKWCRKRELKCIHATKYSSEVVCPHEYILISNKYDMAGRRFDKIIIINDQLFELIHHLSEGAHYAYTTQDSIIIQPERYIS